MVLRKITLGDRTFTAKGIGMGSARRVPGAINTATRVLKQFSEKTDDMTMAPTPAELDDIVALIVDCIQAAKVDTDVTAAVLDEIVNDLDVALAVVQLFNALGHLFKDDTRIATENDAPQGADAGNSAGSKSET